MYNLVNYECWDSTSLINEFDAWQSQFPEELWRLDIQRKYIRPYLGTTDNGITFYQPDHDFLENRMNGRKKYHRRQYERNQAIYMATKYRHSSVTTTNRIVFRVNTPTEAVVKPDYTISIVPYIDMYLAVDYGGAYSTPIRAKAGQTYEIEPPFVVTRFDDTQILIPAASHLESIGDISKCYIGSGTFGAGIRLQELIVGNTTEGYSNSFLSTINFGNNKLLKKLDICNCPNLSGILDLATLPSLETLNATNAGITGVIFADGGALKTATLPAITSLTMKNLLSLTDGLTLAGMQNLIRLVIENCPNFDSQQFIAAATNLRRLRATKVDWTSDTDALLKAILGMSGVSASNTEISQSVLTGKAVVGASDKYNMQVFAETWPDMTVSVAQGGTLLDAFTVTFKNRKVGEYGGETLDVQHVIAFKSAEDPITREKDPIPTPTLVAYMEDGVTIATDYTFTGWDVSFDVITSDLTVTAVYSEKTHEYTIRFKNPDSFGGAIYQTTTAPYGSVVSYEGILPTYTGRESEFHTYSIFKRWDKFPLVTGDMDVTAVYDTCTYLASTFADKKLSELTPVEIYALTKERDESGNLPINISWGDTISFQQGIDYEYDNVETENFISEPHTFTGAAGDYINTGVEFLSEDRDWILVVDYMFSKDTSNSNNVLMGCYQGNTLRGFRLQYNGGTRLYWGENYVSLGTCGVRQMLVLRHKKGELSNGNAVLHIYHSNLPNAISVTYDSTAASATVASGATIPTHLIFGAHRDAEGLYSMYGKGTVFTAKAFYTDIGDDACKQMVLWNRETIMAGVERKRVYYQDNGYRNNLVLFMTHLLTNQMNTYGGENRGGYYALELNDILNGRFYEAVPIEWKQLLKNVQITANDGYKGQDEDVTYTKKTVYFTLPSIAELSSSYNYNDVYTREAGDSDDSGNYAFATVTSSESRVRKYPDGTNGMYFTRSADISGAYSWYRVLGTRYNGNEPGSVNYPWSDAGTGLMGIALEFMI